MRFQNFNPFLLLVAGLATAPVLPVSGQSNPPPEILITDATNYLNQPVRVRAVVAQVAVRPSVVLLNLNHRYPETPLTGVIRWQHTNLFPRLEDYAGQRVEISGTVSDYQGRPQIILTSTNQIKILDATATGLSLPPAAGEPARPAVNPPAAPDKVTAPARGPAEAKATPTPIPGWMVGLLGLVVGLAGSLGFWLWRRHARPGAATILSPSAVVRLPAADVLTEPATAEEWKQRALVAEAMAGRQGQILREKLMPELAEFAKQSLVQGLYAQRNALIETQQTAQKALMELEARLASLQLSLPERIQAYERRIGELEQEVETQGEEMRELTRATLELVRKKLEAERERERLTTRFN